MRLFCLRACVIVMDLPDAQSAYLPAYNCVHSYYGYHHMSALMCGVCERRLAAAGYCVA